MKKVLFLCMALCVSSFLFPFEYIMNTSPSGIGSHQGNVQITALTGGNWDDGYYDLALPAINQFYYYGRKVTHLRICTNGYVVMGFGSASGDGTDFGNESIPNPANEPNGMVAPYWDDLALSGSALGAGEIYYEFVTLANNNNWVSVEWRGVQHRNVPGAVYSFSCAFCSANNCYRPNAIIFVYADVTAGNASYDNGLSATAGIEGPAGTVGEQFSYNQAIVTDGLKIVFTPFVPVYGSTTDIFGSADGFPDAIIFRPSNGKWYTKCSDGSTDTYTWGTKGDIAVPGDYDGDGDSDTCVFRPTNSTWYSSVPAMAKIWGTSGDIPVPADYDGDGTQDLAVFRASTSSWYIFYTGSSTSATVIYGTAGDIPMPGDYDQDGTADIAVYRPSNNKWYARKSSDGTTVSKTWGADSDIPMYTNLNSSYGQVTVYRQSTGFFHAACITGGTATYSRQWGQDGDVPVPGDENAGGYTDPSVFRPGANAHWYLYSSTYLPGDFIWGTLGDKPRFRASNLIVSPGHNNKDE